MTGRTFALFVVIILVVTILIWKLGVYSEYFEANLPPLQGNDMPGLPFAVRIFDSGQPGHAVLIPREPTASLTSATHWIADKSR
jgi:hypothetical protein